MEYTTGKVVFNDWIITRAIGQGTTWRWDWLGYFNSNTKIDGGKVQRMQYDITEDDTGKYYVCKYGKDSSIMYRYEDSVLYKNIIYDNDGNLIKEEQYDFEIAR